MSEILPLKQLSINQLYIFFRKFSSALTLISEKKPFDFEGEQNLPTYDNLNVAFRLKTKALWVKVTMLDVYE